MIFDSDVLIWLARGNPAAVAVVAPEEDRAISIISLMELLQGSRSRQELVDTRRFVTRQNFRIIPVSEAIGYAALALIELHAPGDGLQLGDALIAATARSTGNTLVTGNVRHFRSIAGLSLKQFRSRAELQ